MLDFQKKKDLTVNHFYIGGPSANVIIPTQTIVFRPGSALERQNARPQLNQQMKDDLRRSHWGPI